MHHSGDTLNIAIVGAGIAGLASAFALLKAGHTVTVFEKKQALNELGAGIQLSPNATLILKQWGMLEHIKTLSFEPKGVCFSHWKRGYHIAQFPLNKTQNKTIDQTPYLHIHRADLYQCLVKAVTKLSPNCIHLDREVVGIQESEQACQVLTIKTNRSAANPESEQQRQQDSFDYLIGADGIRSKIKNLMHPLLPQPRFTGNIAWRGLIPVHKLKNKPAEKAHLVMAPNAHLVFYYVKGGKYLNYIAVKEVSSATATQESWSHKGSKDELLEDFKDWHASYLDILAASDPDNCYHWALYDRDPLSTWSTKRSVLIGDAAHPVLPFLAQGAALAIEDADVLAKIFHKQILHKKAQANTATIPITDTSEIGQEFFKQRSQRCQEVLEASRKNRQLYHESMLLKREIRDLGLAIIAKVHPKFLDKKLNWLYRQ